MISIGSKEIEFKTFPNGETLLAHDSEIFLHSGVIRRILFKYESDADLIKLMLLKDYLDEMNISCNGLSIAYMPYSRMDRSENGSPFTLRYVANFINRLNFQNVTIIEPHSDVTCALVHKSKARYVNFDLVEKVKKEINFNDNTDFLVFPDAGASKRYSKMKAKNVLVGHKNRDFETGQIKSLQLVGEGYNGEKAIIVDDLSSYGGTFVHTAKALRERGFEEVYLLVAHAENSIFKGELFNHVDKVFTTDSILTAQNDWANKKFEPQLKIYQLNSIC